MGPRVDAAINATLRLGLPEARIVLSEIVIELALSPKSNSAKMAIDKALEDIHTKNIGDVPNHLKNPSNEYKYPHNYKNDYVRQHNKQHLFLLLRVPSSLKILNFYHFS